MTKTERLLEALKSGEELTAKQIAARFDSAAPYDLVRNLRFRGYAVYLNSRTNRRGEETMKYRLGTPTRAMIATAYIAAGADAFDRAA